MNKKLIDDIQQLTSGLIFSIGLVCLGYGIGLTFGLLNAINLIIDPYQLNITYDLMTKTESNIFLINVFTQLITAIYYIFSGVIFMLIAIIVDSYAIQKLKR